jgi:protoporphyrinogen oxidase
LKAHVVVVGGGIAGLSAAWRLRHRDVLLLEAGDRLGGRFVSIDAFVPSPGRVDTPGNQATGRMDAALAARGVRATSRARR